MTVDIKASAQIGECFPEARGLTPNLGAHICKSSSCSSICEASLETRSCGDEHDLAQSGALSALGGDDNNPARASLPSETN